MQDCKLFVGGKRSWNVETGTHSSTSVHCEDIHRRQENDWDSRPVGRSMQNGRRKERSFLESIYDSTQTDLPVGVLLAMIGNLWISEKMKKHQMLVWMTPNSASIWTKGRWQFLLRNQLLPAFRVDRENLKPWKMYSTLWPTMLSCKLLKTQTLFHFYGLDQLWSQKRVELATSVMGMPKAQTHSVPISSLTVYLRQYWPKR